MPVTTAAIQSGASLTLRVHIHLAYVGFSIYRALHVPKVWPWAGSARVTWEFVRNAEFQPTAQICEWEPAGNHWQWIDWRDDCGQKATKKCESSRSWPCPKLASTVSCLRSAGPGQCSPIPPLSFKPHVQHRLLQQRTSLSLSFLITETGIISVLAHTA